MRQRIKEELDLLRQYYGEVEHKEHGGEDWFRLPRYQFPSGWRIGDAPICEAPLIFKVVAAYPAAEPYSFFAPAGINFNGASPKNVGALVDTPFGGPWQQFSWAPDRTWGPTDDAHKGSNLLTWVRSFAQRLREGV